MERSALAHSLWIKRDDLNAPLLGGNKVRALEYLLAGLSPGQTVITVGGRGSTHALSTVVHAHHLGHEAIVLRWAQEMNAAARDVAARLHLEADHCIDARTVLGVYLRAAALRAMHRLRGDALRWIPAGGTSPLGILGHVNAALELAEQVRAGLLPHPERIVLPLGTGGTAAGLLLGLAVAGLRTRVVGVRVVPRIVARHARVLRLARATARLLEQQASATVPRPDPTRLRIEHLYYGGAYGRETEAGRAAAARFDNAHCRLDATYGAKAFAAALAACDDRPTLFWMTFDSRWMGTAGRLAPGA